ncbi:hypothetical protein AGMMS49587_13450 [Spirochaetia bacterium]|nr:hypothetical protein AGMMS49587_13450 [Spirochaetia bacterium]
MQYRFKAILSPVIENNIINSINHDKIFRFLHDMIKELRKYNTFIIFLIPVELQPYFCTGKFRILLSEMGSTQSNTMFGSNTDKIDCDVPFLVNKTELSYRFSINKFLQFIRLGDFPIFMDYEKLIIGKVNCLNDTCVNQNCKMSIDFDVPAFDITNIQSAVDILAEKNYDSGLFALKAVNKDTIKDLIFIICVMHKIDIYDFTKIDDINYFPDFFHDIKDCEEDELKNILFSAFRGIVYSPAKKKADREKFSIDIHSNNPNSCNGYTLFRIDVVSPRISGIGGNKSGPRRLLIGRKDGHTFVIAYTNQHEFSKNLIENRTKQK